MPYLGVSGSLGEFNKMEHWFLMWMWNVDQTKIKHFKLIDSILSPFSIAMGSNRIYLEKH